MHSVLLSRCGNVAVTGSADGSIRSWCLEDGCARFAPKNLKACSEQEPRSAQLKLWDRFEDIQSLQSRAHTQTQVPNSKMCKEPTKQPTKRVSKQSSNRFAKSPRNQPKKQPSRQANKLKHVNKWINSSF